MPCTEYRTSKCCYHCHHELDDVSTRGDSLANPLKGRHGLRLCTNPNCPEGLLDRDMNAAINMLDCAMDAHFPHLQWTHTQDMTAFAHNSTLPTHLPVPDKRIAHYKKHTRRRPSGQQRRRGSREVGRRTAVAMTQHTREDRRG